MSNASRFIDITLPLSPSTPVWPGDAEVRVHRSVGVAAVSELRLSSHAGTHVDAPAHFIRNGAAIDHIALDTLIGRCWLARVSDAATVTGELLESAGIPREVERLLIATDNSRSPEPAVTFDPDFVAFDQTAVDWLLARRFRLIGIDGPSVDPFVSSSFNAHRALLSQGVVIVENLALHNVRPGAYRLICLPLRFEGGDGAPGRAVLETI